MFWRCGMNKKIMRKKQLEIILEKVKKPLNLKVFLEQYYLDAETAALILYIAAYIFDDIIGKIVYDLGCGSGILAIGAAILGAKKVYGVDLDKESIETAKLNAKMLGVDDKIEWILSNVDEVKGKADTVLQNPPFGVKVRGVDLKFLKKAIEIGESIYSLHKSNYKTFVLIDKLAKLHQYKIDKIFPIKLKIPKTYEFHYKREHFVDVDLYRIIKI